MADKQYDQVGHKRLRRDHDDYTIALFCVLDVELVAMKAMLDEIHDDLPVISANTYVFGSLCNHNVIIVVVSEQGNIDSGIVAARLREDFPSIQLGMVIGVSGGVPGKHGENDIRLGDVVVAEGSSTSAAVIQFDKGKHHASGGFVLSGNLNKPPHDLIALVKKLKAQHRLDGNQISYFVTDMLRRYPRMKQEYVSPGSEQDQLYQASYEHNGQADCVNCSRDQVVKRPVRDPDEPHIHYGPIGTSLSVVKSAAERDRLGDSYNILCVEMEAAGIVDRLPCLVVRGVCDYADSHKNKKWQPYAAATAAAYVKELLQGSLRRRENQLVVPVQVVTRSTEDEVKYKALLNSLAFPRMDARRRTISKPLSQTCGWLKDHGVFRIWMNPEKKDVHRGFLWIKGKPGSGKSTLMKFLLTFETKKRRQYDTVSFFFNARAPSHLEKSSQGLYQSLTHQLLIACPNAQSFFLEQFSSKEMDGEIEDWTEEELKAFLIDVIPEYLQRPLVILIDALDEGDEADIRQLVSFLEELADAAHASERMLRICLSSRHYPHISIKYGVELTVEKQAGHDQDIEKYIRTKLNDDKSASMDELREEIRLKSDSVFLWVVLVIPILNEAYDRGERYNATTMSRCLKDIPPKLDDLFAKILAKSGQDLGDCLTSLQWVLYSRQPLSLDQLYHAVAVTSTSPRFGSSDTSPERIRRCLLDASRGLTEISKGEPPVVQFIHETVREFLKTSGLAQIDPTVSENVEGEGHDKLKLCCSRYIKKCNLAIHDNKTMSKAQYRVCRAKLESSFPLLEYAVMNLFEHADTAECLGKSQREWMIQLDARRGDILQWICARNTFQHAIVRRYTPMAPLLYIMADMSLPNLSHVLVIEGFVDRVSSERYGTALQAACARGHTATFQVLASHTGCVKDCINVKAGECGYAIMAAANSKSAAHAESFETMMKVLINAGADMNVERQLTKHEPPLYLAAKDGFDSVVELLLAAGADANTQSTHYGYALRAACYKGHEQIVRLLIDKGADVNALERHSNTSALEEACSKGYEQIARLLIDEGADVNAQGGYYGNALQLACSEGHENIAQLLINKGANIHAQHNCYVNALQAACYGGCERLVRHLIGMGSEVNAQGGDYGNALHAACVGGYEQIARLLIDGGADVNAQGGKFGTALQAACIDGHEQVALLLIDEGADINAQGGYYGNALQAACVDGHENIARLLIAMGANVTAEGGYYGHALQAACVKGHEQVAQLLIDEGADINAQGGYYGNALQAACVDGHENIARLLISKGADVNAQGGHFRSALRIVCIYGYEQIARLLIDNGVDVNAKVRNDTALAVATRGGYESIVELLLSAGANRG